MKNQTFYTTKNPCTELSLTGLITTPHDFDPAKESLPMIVFLHGSGERGNDPEKVKAHGIPKLFGADCEYQGLRCITVSPQCPEGIVWNHLNLQIKHYIDEVAKAYNADMDRISITGISMGGYGTWDMMISYPDFFSCAAPICGGGIPWMTYTLRGKKLWVFHGLDDNSVDFSCSVAMVEAARRNGAEIDFTAYDHVGHSSWVKAYEETELISWLLSQKRG